MPYPRMKHIFMPILAAAVAPSPASWAEEPAVKPDPRLWAEYQACSASAAVRVLGAAEAQACAQSYLLLKLSLLPGVDLEMFRSLRLAERHRVQQEGYAAYLDWRARSEREGAFPDGGG